VGIITSANTVHVRALEIEDSSAIGSAPNKSNPVAHAASEDTDSCKGLNFLDTPIHMCTLKASPHNLFRVIVGGPWVEEEGWHERG